MVEQHIEPKEKIQAAIINLQYRKVYDASTKTHIEKGNPFFAYLAMMLKPKVMSPDKEIRTMCVNAKGELEFDLDFVGSLTVDEVMGVLCHEILHVGLLHCIGNDGRNPLIANIAKDMAVNCLVTHENITLPKIGVIYRRYDDMSYIDIGGQKVEIWNVSKKAWETIYDELYPILKDKPAFKPKMKMVMVGGKGREDGNSKDEGKGNGSSNKEAYGGFDEHEIGGGSNEELAAEADKWQRAIAEAANYAKQQGKLGANIGRIVDEILTPKVNWGAVLMYYLQPYLMPGETSYARPSKKSFPLGIYLPAVTKENLEIEVVIDTSGSIANDEIVEFLSEVCGIQEAFPHVEMTVCFADTEIKSRKTVRDVRRELNTLDIKGGGGTSMEGALRQLMDRSEASVIIVFTDGVDDYHMKQYELPFDVIWVLSEKGVELDAFDKNGPSYGERFKLTR